MNVRLRFHPHNEVEVSSLIGADDSASFFLGGTRAMEERRNLVRSEPRNIKGTNWDVRFYMPPELICLFGASIEVDHDHWVASEIAVVKKKLL